MPLIRGGGEKRTAGRSGGFATIELMEHTVTLAAYHGVWDPGDRDANFKAEVACYSAADPLPTVANLSRGTGIPEGCLIRYILVKWAASGSEALMAMGPIVFEQMRQQIEKAEATGTDEGRLAAYDVLRQIIGWLGSGDGLGSIAESR